VTHWGNIAALCNAGFSFAAEAGGRRESRLECLDQRVGSAHLVGDRHDGQTARQAARWRGDTSLARATMTSGSSVEITETAASTESTRATAKCSFARMVSHISAARGIFSGDQDQRRKTRACRPRGGRRAIASAGPAARAGQVWTYASSS